MGSTVALNPSASLVSGPKPNVATKVSGTIQVESAGALNSSGSPVQGSQGSQPGISAQASGNAGTDDVQLDGSSPILDEDEDDVFVMGDGLGGDNEGSPDEEPGSDALTKAHNQRHPLPTWLTDAFDEKLKEAAGRSVQCS